MGKIAIKGNFRVEVSPEDSRNGLATICSEAGYRDACAEIAKQIKRHVDGVGGVEIRYDADEYCEYCGGSWEPFEDGCNSCCDKECKEFYRRKEQKEVSHA